MKPIPQDIKEREDHEILALSLENPDCFGFIVERYQDLFIKKVSAILRDEDKAKDIVQDTFVKIYVHAKKFSLQEGASFKSWAYRILLNTCFTYCKKVKREKEFFSFADQETMALMGDAGGEFEKKLDLDHFLTIASKIPKMLSRVLTLTVFEGKTDEQIAVLEGVSASAVRVRLHRAKKEFKKADSIFS